MILNLNYNKIYNFKELAVGELCRMTDTKYVYLKIQPIKTDNWEFNAINLYTNIGCRLNDEQEVIKINGEFVEK